ncbi:MAG: rhomboid family intramembrane serine protease [Kiritimatiellaeota bacterium]|nr:rhomboid family intramembrane serine protease [Kiritimatiellota bacterium]
MPVQYETVVNHNDSSRNFISHITFNVKWLIIANTVVFLVISILSRFGLLDIAWILNTFGQVNSAVFAKLRIWQFATALFLHGGIAHLAGNLFYLWIFGTLMEEEFGGRRFIIYYFMCGIGAGLLQFCVAPTATIPGIGASGAIFGLLGGCAVLFPNREAYVFMAKVKLKYIVAILTAIEIYACVMGTRDGIGHWVHVSGFAIGIIYIKTKWFFLRGNAAANISSTKGGRFDNIEL